MILLAQSSFVLSKNHCEGVTARGDPSAGHPEGGQRWGGALAGPRAAALRVINRESL
jgi:hypothetical protein